MKERTKILTAVFSAMGMFVLILDPKTAMQGAAEGLDLCIRTVIPALFPFFVLSGLLTGALLGEHFAVLKPIGKLCKIPEGAESLFLVGILGGYPVGAKCVAQAYSSGQLSRDDAKRMLGFCSNAGPSFLFGMAGTLFPNSSYSWLLFAIQILSALATGILLPGQPKSSATKLRATPPSLVQSLRSALHAMAGVCGWIIVFRVLLTFCDRWFLWLLPMQVKVVFTGICELSNGIFSLFHIQSLTPRFVLCSAMLSLGGVCVLMQTMTVTEGLGLGAYIPGKLLQCALSTLLAFLITIPVSNISSWIFIFTGMVVFLWFVWRKKENNSSFCKSHGV